MDNWDRDRQDKKYKQKLKNVKSTLPKIIYSNNTTTKKKRPSNLSNNINLCQNGIYKLPSTYIQPTNDKKDFKKQSNLKHLLSEFGLSQYLRKIYELGYDDNNYYKIGMLTRNEFNDFIYNIHIYPGQMVKMENFYEYLKQMNYNKVNYSSNIYSNKPKSSTGGKRINYSNQINYPNTAPISSNTTRPNTTNILMKPKSNSNNLTPISQRINIQNNSNNMIVNSFINGEFGYNYFMQDYNDKTQSNINKFNTERYYNNLGGKIINNNNGIEEKVNNNMDNMLKYYMNELNEKLDESYNTIEDSSLSNINITTSVANIDVLKKNNQDLNNKKDISNNSLKNNLDTNPPINKKSIPVKLPGIKNEDNINNNNNINPSNNINKNNNNNILKNKEQKRKVELKPIEKKDSKNIEQDKEEEIIDETIEIKKNIPQNEKEKKKQIESGLINFEEIEENFDPIKEKNNKLSLSPPIQINKFTSSGDFNNQNLPNLERKTDNNNDRYNKEQQVYDNIRLIKSSEGDYIHQNMEQFDIEYMCRCLGLTIMKHLESAKGKQHICDLVNLKDFIFFNSLYNSNMNFLFNFFDKSKPVPDNQMSNLDKLEMEEKKIKNEKMDDDIISFVHHFKHKSDENLIKDAELKGNKSKLHGNLQEIEKDIKFIDEFFSIKKAVRNYQNVSEKSKNILCKELSYIGEVDSELTISKINTSNQLKQEEKKDNELEYLDEEETDDKNKKLLYEIEEEKKIDNMIFENNNNEDFKEIINNNKTENKSKRNVIKELKDTVNIGSLADDNDLKIKDEEKKDDTLNNKFNSLQNENNQNKESENEKDKIKEEIKEENNEKEKEIFESGSMESDYLIDGGTVEKIKQYLLKQIEIFDDDYIYASQHIPARKYVPPPDPQTIFEFCANIMILTKMEKEVIIISLIYLERFIFNTGLLLSPRNWRRLIFIIMVIASKIWDDDSFENNHFAQVFPHLKLGEINLMEKTFLELINYKVYVKCSEYFKYFFIIKSIALKYNYNGTQLIPISVEKMMKIQEYAYLMQKKMRKKFSLNNSAQF